MEGERRKRLDAQTWGAVLERFKQSGLSVAQFCEREGLGTASFYRWCSILEPKTASRRTSRPREAVKPGEPVREFLDLGTVGSKGNDLSRMEVRLDLGGGLVLHVVRS
jgi:hypothetical protein